MSQKASRSKKSSEAKIDASFSLARIEPITEAQKDVVESFNEGFNLVLMGSAGTGKTFLSLFLALNDIIRGKGERPSKIVLIRSIVSTRDIGFLPGTLREKMAVYEEPYKGIFSELFNRGDAWEILKTKGIVEFCSTSYLRGTTLNNTYIVLDEFQNCNYEEIRTIITRVGKNSRLIFCGDTKQNDLYRNKYDVSGMQEIVNIIEKMKEFDIVDFEISDIVRSDLVKSFIVAEEEYLTSKGK